MSLYYANFYSIMSYCIIVWGGVREANRIFLIQKRAVRIIAKTDRRESCRVLFKNLKLLTFTSVYIFKLCVFVFKNIDIFKCDTMQHQYETRKNNLMIPTHRLTLYKKACLYNGITIFNKIPDNIKNIKSLKHFKNKLKTFLIERNFYSLDEFS